MTSGAEYTCDEPPWTTNMRQLEAKLVRRESPTLLEVAMACPPDAADEHPLQRFWVIAGIIEGGGSLSTFVERRFPAEVAALLLAPGEA